MITSSCYILLETLSLKKENLVSKLCTKLQIPKFIQWHPNNSNIIFDIIIKQVPKIYHKKDYYSKCILKFPKYIFKEQDKEGKEDGWMDLSQADHLFIYGL